MKLSIIVPVYNVGTLLQKCVDSLLDQDLLASEFEIILVDDGSTDSSGQSCDYFAATYHNIHVIHQHNKGLSCARNAGISVAKGEYVQFVDSDDYLNPKVLGTLVKLLESQDLDILRFNYQNVNLSGEVFEPNKYFKPFVDFSGEVCNGLSFLNERLGFACYACQFIVRTAILRQEGNGFREGIYYEDVEWTPRILLQAQRIASTEMVVYNYLFRTDSIARNADMEKNRKAIEDKLSILEGFNSLGRLIEDQRWFKGMSAQIALSIFHLVGKFFYPERKEYIGKIKKMGLFPLSAFHATPSAKRKIWLANLSPFLVCWLYRRSS